MGCFSINSKIYQVLGVIFYTLSMVVAEHFDFEFWMFPTEEYGGLLGTTPSFSVCLQINPGAWLVTKLLSLRFYLWPETF